jgi:hypothetical protein
VQLEVLPEVVLVLEQAAPVVAARVAALVASRVVPVAAAPATVLHLETAVRLAAEDSPGSALERSARKLQLR